MRITLTGATGFLGRHLIQQLSEAGDSICLLSRKPVTGLPKNVETFLWDAQRAEPPAEALQDSDAVIHLAGSPVSQRWTEESKALIRSSRIDSTRLLVQALSSLSRRPPLLLSASAIGFYGERGDEFLTEASAPGDDFLAGVSVEWEKQANLARNLGLRVLTLRTGVVLGKEGGALPSILPPFRFGIGGQLGSGQQFMSWIHVADWVGLVKHLLSHQIPSGPINLTAPNPARNAEFTRTLGQVLRRPAIFTVPAFALKAILGEMSGVVLTSQRVHPKLAESSGYVFLYPQLESALRNLLH